MDPISIITVLQWTSQASITLYDFISTIRSAPDEIALLAREVHALYGSLRSLTVGLQDPDIQAYVQRNPALKNDIEALDAPLRLCARRVGELMVKLEGCTESKGGSEGIERKVKAVKWYFIKSDVQSAKAYLGDVRDTVAFAVGNSNFVETLRSHAAASGSNTNDCKEDFSKVATKEESKSNSSSQLPIDSPTVPAHSPSPPSLTAQIRDLQAQGTALRRAARDDDIRALELLLSAGVPVDSKSYQGRTALSHAAECGSIAAANVLLQKGANPNIAQNVIDPLKEQGSRGRKASSPNQSKRMPLHWAASTGHTTLCVQLLASGARLEARSASQRTPVQEAAIGGHLDTVEALLDRGADVNTRTYYGWTLLHSAATKGQVQLAALLVQRHADVEAVYNGTWHGEGKGEHAKEQRALHYAVRPTTRPPLLPKNAREQDTIGDGEARLIEILVRDGKAKITAPDSEGATPLHYAVRAGWKEGAFALLRHGLNDEVLRAVDGQGRTAVEEAEMRGDGEMVELLRGKGRWWESEEKTRT